MFSMKFNVFFGYSGFQTSLFVVDPSLRQEQSMTDRYRMFFGIQNRKNAGLAIFDFAELATPLSRDAYGLVSLFWHAGFVNYQAAVISAANQKIRITGNLTNNPVFVPWRICQEVLKNLIVRIWNRFSHTFHVLFICLDPVSYTHLTLPTILRV